MAHIQYVRSSLQGGTVSASYVEEQHRFSYSVTVTSPSGFVLKEVTITEGPYKGMSAFVAVPEARVMFSKLPIELRHNIYKMLFTRTNPTRMTNRNPANLSQLHTTIKHLSPTDHEAWDRDRCHPCRSHPHRRNSRLYLGPSRPSELARKPFKTAALLLTSRTFGHEAAEFLYRCRDFVFDSMRDFDTWREQIGRADAKNIAHLTIRKGALSFQRQCYESLGGRLECLSITLPYAFKGDLSEHMRKQFEDGKGYFLADGLDEAGALRRAGKVNFGIGGAQAGVLDARGEPIGATAEELNLRCKIVLAGYIKEHFERVARKEGKGVRM